MVTRAEMRPTMTFALCAHATCYHGPLFWLELFFFGRFLARALALLAVFWAQALAEMAILWLELWLRWPFCLTRALASLAVFFGSSFGFVGHILA